MTEQLHFHFSLSCIGERNGNPLQCSCLENPRDGGALWAAVYGVTQGRTRLKRLSCSIHTHTHTQNWGNLSKIGRLYQCWHFDCNIIILQDVTLWRNQSIISYNCMWIYNSELNVQLKCQRSLKKRKKKRRCLTSEFSNVIKSLHLFASARCLIL